jgi:ketosteroid isomerase-like protein
MKTSLKIAVIAFVAFIATTTAFAQEWTKEQKEVWKVVEDSWTSWKAGDIEGATDCIHEKYQGWNEESPLPLNKAMVKAWFNEMKEKGKADYFSLNPARIVVYENAAVVDYFFNISVTYTVGETKKQETAKGRNAEFYVKVSGKWLLLGDMTVYEDKEDKD